MMRLKLVSAVAALMVCSAVQANCMRETFGATICGQGPAPMTGTGGFFARPNVTALLCETTRVRLSVDWAVVSKTSSPDEYCVRANPAAMP